MDVMLRVSISVGGSTPAIQRDSWPARLSMDFLGESANGHPMGNVFNESL
jgi:hypothetical protein